MGRWGLRLGAALIALPLLYLSAGLLGAAIPGPRAATGGEPSLAIALASGPIHVDMLLPLDPEIRQRFDFAAASGVPVNAPEARYLVVGWGSKGFYTTTGSYGDLSLPVVLRAMTGDSAVLHLDVAGDLGAVPDLIWLPLSPAVLDRLSQGILDSLSRDGAGPPQLVKRAVFTPSDAFFAAEGRFSLAQTCNVWLGQQLRAAGLGFGLWTPTPQAVWLSAALWR